MENILDRIKAYIDSKGISIRQLERTIGASNGVLSTAIKRGSDIGSKWLSKIVASDSKLNAKWLLTGTGDMYIANENTPLAINEPTSDYTKNCKECKTKEKTIFTQEETIKAQQKTIDTQSDYIDILKQSRNISIEKAEKKSANSIK
jgi:hypothetical protein